MRKTSRKLLILSLVVLGALNAVVADSAWRNHGSFSAPMILRRSAWFQ